MNEIRINVPKGYEIDKENSTFECIKFKPIISIWRDNKNNSISGWYIGTYSTINKINSYTYTAYNYNIFATANLAKSALAMARISQIMANDSRFGGVVTDKEWNDETINKFIIDRYFNQVSTNRINTFYRFLAFHTAEQRDLFLKENIDLVKDYLMID